MIRFVDLRPADCGMLFSFFNTVNDQYITLSGRVAWDCELDLKIDFEYSEVTDKEFLNRLLGLIPDWVTE